MEDYMWLDERPFQQGNQRQVLTFVATCLKWITRHREYTWKQHRRLRGQKEKEQWDRGWCYNLSVARRPLWLKQSDPGVKWWNLRPERKLTTKSSRSMLAMWETLDFIVRREGTQYRVWTEEWHDLTHIGLLCAKHIVKTRADDVRWLGGYFSDRG